MNKAITDGVVLMPPAYAEGLNQWSSGDGTPGSATYQGAGNAALVSADQDFRDCLEMVKTDTVQKLRFMGETPLLPGCYLRISARIKAVAGNLPPVRVAGWAGGAGGGHVGGLTETGPSVTLTSYGEVVEVTAIVGPGLRTGVDMVWGAAPLFGHFGIDLTGANGGVVRIDNIVIEDITSAFLRTMMNWVDVRDYGALGDGITDDSAAFEAADQDAGGRKILVSAGSYYLGSSVTLENPVEFEGSLMMPDSAILSLTKSFDLPTYINAFVGDEEQAFRKAFQSLLNNADHESLDMGGRRVTVNGPLDMALAVNNKTTYAQRRLIRNGQLNAAGDTVWEPTVVTSQATYNPADPKTLTGVVNAANVPVGALVEGNGVGREVYVRDVNIAAQEVTLSSAPYDASGTQVFTFRRFKYLLDFSGFEQLTMFELVDVELQCNFKASGIMLAKTGITFHIKDCFITRPRYRGITSIGTGCQGMLVDRCHFVSGENGELVQNRETVVLNANANDVKLRNNWASQHLHFAVLGGSNNLISGNHFYQGDAATGGIRSAGIVLTASAVSSTIVGNYVDNCFIEWTNEHDAEPDYVAGFGFVALSITNNTFLCGNVAPWFTFIVVKPFGSGHSVKGLNAVGNTFRAVGAVIDRVDRVDTSFAGLNWNAARNIHFAGNTFNNVQDGSVNPLTVVHAQNTEATAWMVEGAPNLPFGAPSRMVESVVVTDRLRTASNAVQYLAPYAEPGKGPGGSQVQLNWSTAVRGGATVRMRMHG